MPVPNRNRFKPLLRVRERQEEDRSRALADVRRAIAAARSERDDLEKQHRSMLHRAATTARDHFDASDVQRFFQYGRYLAKLVNDKDAEIAELRQHERSHLDELTRAIQERRKAERLDDRREVAFEQFLTKEENKQADETAVIRTWLDKAGAKK